MNFKNTIIIMTGNLGSDLIRQRLSDIPSGCEQAAINETRELILGLLRKTIRPEFLNRIDETIVFTPLGRSEIDEIIHIQLDSTACLLQVNGVKPHYTPEAVEWIGKEGYGPEFGARPVRLVIQHTVLNKLSKSILSGAVDRASVITLDVEDGQLRFR